jgi:hypothetical protein
MQRRCGALQRRGRRCRRSIARDLTAETLLERHGRSPVELGANLTTVPEQRGALVGQRRGDEACECPVGTLTESIHG